MNGAPHVQLSSAEGRLGWFVFRPFESCYCEHSRACLCGNTACRPAGGMAGGAQGRTLSALRALQTLPRWLFCCTFLPAVRGPEGSRFSTSCELVHSSCFKFSIWPGVSVFTLGEAASTWAVHRSQSRTSLDLQTLRESPEGTSQAPAARGAEQSAGGVGAGVILCGCHPGRGPRLPEGQPQRCRPVLTFLSLQS